jgi:hypothetical protein
MAVNAGEVSVEMLLDFERSEREAKDFEAQIANTMASVSNLGPEHYKEFAKRASAHLKKVEADTQKTAAALAKAAEMGGFKNKLKNVAREAPGFLGDVGDAVNLLGKDFLGLNSQQMEAIDNTLSLAEKGGQMGAVFGPWGALLGAAAGAALGLWKANEQAALSMEKLGKKAIEARERMKLFIDMAEGTRDAAKAVEKYNEGLLELDEIGQKKTLKELAKDKEVLASNAKYAGLALESERKALKALEKDVQDGKKTKQEYEIAAKAFSASEREATELLGKAKAAASEYASTLERRTTKAVKDHDKAVKELGSGYRELMDIIGGAGGASLDAARKLNEATEKLLFGITAKEWESFNKEFHEAGVSFAKEAEQLTAYEDTALAVADAWGNQALAGFNKFLDGVQAGNKIIGSMDWDEALVSFLRLTGSQLMASGLQHELAAAAAWFLGNKKDAVGLAAVGAAELATGAAMGGTGALIGRRRGVGGGGGEDRGSGGGNFPLGRNASAGSTTTNNSQTFIIQALDIGDRELWERLGARVERARGAFRRAGGKLLDGRN